LRRELHCPRGAGEAKPDPEPRYFRRDEAWKPHAKYRYVFAVIRLDDFHSPDAPLEHRFHVKVMLTEDAAEQEAARLNALNSEKNCRYVVHIAQLDER
jgi:hypothetical protein